VADSQQVDTGETGVGGVERKEADVPKKAVPHIEAVHAGEQPFLLRIRWARGEESLVDVSGMIETFRIFAPLRADPDRFAAVKVRRVRNPRPLER